VTSQNTDIPSWDILYKREEGRTLGKQWMLYFSDIQDVRQGQMFHFFMG
jgi:hypothetical protein